jgi:hypothetical protein
MPVSVHDTSVTLMATIRRVVATGYAGRRALLLRSAAGVNNCFWITQYVGDSFHLVPGMDPLCGYIIPGKTVSSS